MGTGIRKKIGITAVCSLLALPLTGMASLLPTGSEFDTALQAHLDENGSVKSKFTDRDETLNGVLLARGGGGGNGGGGAGNGGGAGEAR